MIASASHAFLFLRKIEAVAAVNHELLLVGLKSLAMREQSASLSLDYESCLELMGECASLQLLIATTIRLLEENTTMDHGEWRTDRSFSLCSIVPSTNLTDRISTKSITRQAITSNN